MNGTFLKKNVLVRPEAAGLQGKLDQTTEISETNILVREIEQVIFGDLVKCEQNKCDVFIKYLKNCKRITLSCGVLRRGLIRLTVSKSSGKEKHSGKSCLIFTSHMLLQLLLKTLKAHL